jgi:hypothetical protein
MNCISPYIERLSASAIPRLENEAERYKDGKSRDTYGVPSRSLGRNPANKNFVQTDQENGVDCKIRSKNCLSQCRHTSHFRFEFEGVVNFAIYYFLSRPSLRVIPKVIAAKRSTF